MSNTSNVCTLVWPKLRGADGRHPPPQGNAGAWIVGWNPNGLSVVVAALLADITFQEATEALEKAQRGLAGCATPYMVPSYKALQLLGYVRARSQRSGGDPANFPAASPTAPSLTTGTAANVTVHSKGTKHAFPVGKMRKGDIWLELVEGPILGEVWCCGYRVDACQLHVVRCDPSERYAVKPTVFSPISLYGVGGISQLKSGAQTPATVPGAISNMEGVLLPPVMAKESAPRSVQRRKSIGGRGDGTQDTAPRQHSSSNQGSAYRHATSITTDSFQDSGSDVNPGSFSSFHRAAQESYGEFGSYNESMSQFMGNVDPAGKLYSGAVLPGVPPRLDFVTSADSAEMNVLLTMSMAGYRVHRILQDGLPTPNVIKEVIDPTAGAKTEALLLSPSGGDHGSMGEGGSLLTSPYVHNTLSCLIEVMLVVLRVVSQLRKVSWLMEILEHRIREVVNVLSLLANRTDSCGLHPALPHRARPTPAGRLVCCMTYALRVLADVACGAFVMLVLRTQGPRMYTMAMHMSRYFIYEMHMSYMDWFDGWPAGLKVNEDLNQALCFFAKIILRVWDLVMRGLFFTSIGGNANVGAILSNYSSLAANSTNGVGNSSPVVDDHDVFGSLEYFWIVPSYDVLVPLSFLGASCSFALVADITGLVTLHLRLLYHAMSLPYLFIRTILYSLSNQFRGKKYNPLRRRIDVYEFAIDQMLMATFIFTIVVLLFPTVAVYYFYFAVIRTSMWCVQESLVAVAHVMMYLPVLSVAAWGVLGSKRKSRLTAGVELSEPIVTMVRNVAPPSRSVYGEYHRGQPSTTVEMTVVRKPLPMVYLLSDFCYVVSVLVRPFTPGKVISLILSGQTAQPTSPRVDLIPHLLVNCTDPPCTLCIPEGTPESTLTSAAAAAAGGSWNAAQASANDTKG